ncbi:MAG: hypothetical protein WCG05_05390 [Alphaproteobacteria bacterium]
MTRNKLASFFLTLVGGIGASLSARAEFPESASPVTVQQMESIPETPISESMETAVEEPSTPEADLTPAVQDQKEPKEKEEPSKDNPEDDEDEPSLTDSTDLNTGSAQSKDFFEAKYSPSDEEESA